MPIMPRLSGCDAGTPPMPSSVTAIGMRAFSASAMISRSAPDSMMPWPARISGRSAALISATASAAVPSPGSASSIASVRCGSVASQSTSHELVCASLVMSTSTGPGRPLAGDGERFADRRRDVFGARHQVVVLRDRQRDAGDVGFLERVGSDQLAAHLSGDADDRRRVEHRRRDAGDHVRRARARTSQSRRRPCRSRARSRRPCASRPVRGGRARDESGTPSIAS